MPWSGEGVEPVRGKAPTKDVLYILPAAPVIPGLMLSFEALDALEGQWDKEGQHGTAAPSSTRPSPGTAGHCGPGHILGWEAPQKVRGHGWGVAWSDTASRAFEELGGASHLHPALPSPLPPTGMRAAQPH